MTRERIFFGNGYAPPRGLNPIVGALIILYIIFVIYIISTYGMRNVRITGPGPLLIYAAHRGTRNKEGEAVSVFVDKKEGEEICFGYNIKNKEKEFLVDEYSYWYYPCKGEKGKTKQFELVFKIKTPQKETVYLLEETDEIRNTMAWNMLEQKPDTGEITFKVFELENLAAAVDRNS
jgi:hypothetical protein